MARRSNKGLYAALAAVFVAAFLCQVYYSYDAVVFYRRIRMQLPFALGSPWPTVTAVREPKLAGGIQKGDRILALERQPVRGYADITPRVQRSKPGDELLFTVQQAGRVAFLRIRLSKESDPAPFPVMAWTVVSFVLTPLLCFALGFWVVLIRPREPLAWLLLGLMLSFSSLFSGNQVDMTGWRGWIRVPAIVWRTLSATAWPVWMLLFGLCFPRRFEWERRLWWLKWVLIIPLVGYGGVIAAISVGRSESYASIERLMPLVGRFDGVHTIVGMVAVGVFFGGLHTKFWFPTFAKSPDEERRLKMLIWGSSISLTPMFILLIDGLVNRGRLFENTVLLMMVILMLCLFPVTMAYVVVVARALDVRVAIRQGVQYALARGGVRVIQIAISFAVVLGAALLAVDPEANRPRRIMMISFGIALVFVVQMVAQRLSVWIDRRFFREAFDAQRILTSLSEDVRTIVETRPLLETLAHRISETLHVPRIAMLIQDGGAFVPAYAIGYSGAPEARFGPENAEISQLRDRRQAVRVEPGRMPPLDSEVLLPLAAKDRLLGFISLGAKKSEEPYSGSDLRLLESVATQAGLALENSQLTAAIASEVAQRERLNRELEIAREVQERLFPQDRPAVAGLDYAGYCRPARGVGGDYYDFLVLPGGQFGLAIGDVSGKGIPAALLMAGLQASLRSQTINGSADLAALMSNMNRLIFDATPSNRYATFFYGQYDTASRRLVYVNAGHNPPLVVRGEEVLRLEAGGPVIGLFRPAQYEQGVVELSAGDLVLFFTDGISEAMNSADEEWGEDSLVVAARTCGSLDAEAMIPRLMAAADAFVAGAPQHDDMTIVVVRVLESGSTAPGAESA